MSPFRLVNPLKYLLVIFSSRLLPWMPTFPAIIYISNALVGSSADDLYFYVFSYPVFCFFIEILSFDFCLVNSKCDAYLPVDYILVYGHSKMFLILSVESNLEFGLKPSFSVHISLSFCFLPLDLVSCRTGIRSSTLPSL